ncbi:hypothetical protein Syun_000955 [Stephania yunnanensis]|uniref:Uncharacterized protein n=1 Tax=Stephania yunnanensis TaxID=152371 RepID=A0AAP0LDW5_9MAGN
MARVMARPIWFGLAMVLLFGFFTYMRLWSIHSDFSHADTDLIRKQFDLANREAMDESAEWRFKYDEVVERAAKCVKDLIQAKEALDKKVEDFDRISEEMADLEKEKSELLDQVKILMEELESEKSRCSFR